MEVRLLAAVALLFVSRSSSESLQSIDDASSGSGEPETKSNLEDTQGDAKCSDAFLRCFKWKDLNICKDPRFESYMKYGCAKTCSYCGLDANPHPTTNPPAPTTRVTTPTAKRSHEPSDASGEQSDLHARFNPEKTLERLAIERETVEKEDSREKVRDDDHVTSMMDAVQGSKRALTFKTETMPRAWSLGVEDAVKMSDEVSPYGSEADAVPNPMEEGKYVTPAKSDERYDYFTGHYSNDPYVAESQREEWNDRNQKITGDSYRKSTGEKPQDKTSESKSEAADAAKKANVEELTDKQTHGKLEIHSL